jgi:GAF domain-containing protein
MLLMTAGYGETGSEMRAQGHSIPISAPKSLVARAAREGKVITVENVRLDPDWLPNPLLPDTYSEMAVPVMLGHQVVGVLDVQSEQIGGLTHEDEVALQALANQVATAVRNARLFTQTQEALYEAQRLQQLYTSQAWEKLGSTRSLDYEFRQTNLPPLTVTPIPEAVAALQQKRTVDLRTPVAETKNGQHQDESQPPASNNHAALATPLRLRDQVIGVLGIHCDDPRRRWSEDEIALIEAVSEQMSLAIENARLFEETGRRAGRERIIADVTQQVWASGELERVMQTAVEQLGTKLEASKVIIRLGTEEQLLAVSPPIKNINNSSEE